jgi:hypothetical protein
MSISVSGSSRTWASWLARFLTATKSKTPLANLQRNPLHLEFTEAWILSYTSECYCFKNLSGRHVAIVTENDASNWGKKQKACHFSDLKPVTIQVWGGIWAIVIIVIRRTVRANPGCLPWPGQHLHHLRCWKAENWMLAWRMQTCIFAGTIAIECTFDLRISTGTSFLTAIECSFLCAICLWDIAAALTMAAPGSLPLGVLHRMEPCRVRIARLRLCFANGGRVATQGLHGWVFRSSPIAMAWGC